MAASVETRLPYLDPDVLAVALNLPLEARIAPRPKGVLHDVAARRIPAKIVKRLKIGGMGVDASGTIRVAARPEFLEHGMLRDTLELDTERWRELTASTGASGSLRLWTAEIWCRLFLERQDVARVENDLWLPASL